MRAAAASWSDDLKTVLADVRAAVRDWPKLQAKMREDAAAIEDPEGRALLEWFADGAMTLLGYEVERATGQPTDSLGIFSIPGAPTDEGGALGAMRYFEAGGDVPLMAKAERKSSVHRRRSDRPRGHPAAREGEGHRDWRSCRPVDQPGADMAGRRSSAPASAAGAARQGFRLRSEGTFSGKALRHAVSSLPRDLLVSVGWDSLRDLVMMAMSLADRPRPALLLVRSILKGQLFTFVWLPREDLNTQRRQAIGAMMEEVVGRKITSWSSRRARATSR